MSDAQHLADFTVAVFSSGSDLILVCLEDDADENASADAAARGYKFAGSIAIIRGAPKVSIEAGYAAAMTYAGALFAEMLPPGSSGTKSKRHMKGTHDGRSSHGSDTDSTARVRG